MKAYKILSAVLAAALLSGCGMPEMSYENVDSPFFKEDSGKESAKGAEGNGSSGPAATDSGGSTESGTAQGTAESGKTESGKTESKKTESAETESVKTEPEKVYKDPESASAISLSRIVTVKDGKTSCELTAISTETNEASAEYGKLNTALKKIPEGEAL